MKAGKSGTYREVGNGFSKNYDSIFNPKEKTEPKEELNGDRKEKEDDTKN